MGKVTSKLWVARLAKVFPKSDLDFSAQLVRLSVLYEDLKIEFEGASAELLDRLDGSGREYRRFYFLRRTTATLLEISGAFTKLGMNPAFKVLKCGFPSDRQKAWDGAVSFLQQNHATLNKLRNAVGGHFHDDAAKYGVENIHQDSVGTIEVHLTETKTGAGVRFKFALEFVALALMNDKPQGDDDLAYIETLFTMLKDAVVHCSHAVQVLADEILLDRFK